MTTPRPFGTKYGHWIVLSLIGACALAAACSQDASESSGTLESRTTTTDPEVDGSTPPEEPEVDGNAPPGESGGKVGASSVATEPNLRVAFIGDTGSGADFKSVLKLVKKEGADLLLVQGDLTYNGAKATDWFPAIDNEINAEAPGSTATVTIPYFAAKGNHDRDWANLGSGLKARMASWGVTPAHNDPTTLNYSVVYKGLKIVMVADSETSNPSRGDYVKQQLKDDTHIWKICSWHKNQRASNVGPKNDEMGWGIYENCRASGAFVAQGHSHTYSRSKTLTNDANQTVDPTCNDPFSLCVGPGKHFFFDSSLGGQDSRPLNTSVAAMRHWGSTFGGSFGALFVDFNVDGDPRKARGYFKTIGGTIVDPPASSGKTSFEIISSN
jgi:hypothetical protein